MAKDNHIVIDIPEAKIDFSNPAWKDIVKKDFLEIQKSLENKPNPASPAYYTWFWFFMKYGRTLCSKEGQAYLKINGLNPFTFVKDVVGLTMSGGGAYTIGYKFFEECLNNTLGVEVGGITIKKNEFGSDTHHIHPLQQIYYGAPGTGKSNAIKEMTGEKGNGEGRMFAKDFTFRTTFHPDSDYASFVGAYKPVWDKEEKLIVYTFRPQTFLKAYVAAWLHPDENVALVVEEINRGNCAQIFGDIFQLLDREDRENDAIGLSKYPIETDIDMQDFLHSSFYKKTKDENGQVIKDANGKEEELLVNAEQSGNIDDYYKAHYDDAFSKIVNGEILTLPKNLSILATMNTSDQSLFPMDSAFKRRWEWIYQGIVEGTEKDGITKLGWQIKIDEKNTVDWWRFLRSINDEIARLTTSEDKQLGYFFCMPNLDEKTISADRFVGKVIFYLWNDIFKDYAFEPSCCKNKDNKEVLYADFYTKTDGKTIDTAVLTHFFETLKDPDDDKQSLLKTVEEPKTNEPEQPDGQTQAEELATE